MSLHNLTRPLGALPGRDPWAVKLERILATMEKEFEGKLSAIPVESY